jgi:hypothetical protein
VVTITFQRRGVVRHRTTWTSLKPAVIVKGTTATNRVTLKPRVGGRALRAGAYRLSVTAADIAGNRSGAQTIAFTVVKG